MYNLTIKRGLLRKNWVIDLQFNVDDISFGIIREKMNFEFELINITQESIIHTFKILQLTEDVNHLYTISKLKDSNNIIDEREIIFSSTDFNTDYSFNGIMGLSKQIELEPGITYYIHVDFETTQYVSKEFPCIHNAFAPRETTSALTIKAIVPMGYEFHVSGLEGIKPHKCQNIGKNKVMHYKIPQILLPSHIVEYTFRKEQCNNE